MFIIELNFNHQIVLGLNSKIHYKLLIINTFGTYPKST
jgi:hypothetical protein